MVTIADAQLRPAPGASATGPPARARQVARLAPAVGPALVVALALAVIVAGGLIAGHGDPLVFVRFGADFARVIRPPRGASVLPGTGYDGQYFWALSQDPWLGHGQTLAAFADQGFRLQRIAYPALAWLLALGRPPAIGWSLLGLNVLVVLGATAGFSLYARARGWSAWWGAALGLLPGCSYAVLGDLSDALATTAMLGGLVAWRHARLRLSAGLLTLACLAREPMTLAVVAVAVQATLDGAPGRCLVRRALSAVRMAPVALPAACFFAWQGYIHLRAGGSSAAPGTAFALPFAQFALEGGRALSAWRSADGMWELLYLGVMLAGIIAGLAQARRGATAPAVAAGLFALTLPVLVFGGAWSYTRLSAPMLACLLLVGLERRARGPLSICLVATGLGALVPLGIG